MESGADLSELSTFEFEGGFGKGASESSDYIPAGGWFLLLETIFKNWCEPELRLNELVTSIDYSGEMIVVSTSAGNYTTKNLYVSASLGALKANKINFTPPLPADKQQAIRAIGFGAF